MCEREGIVNVSGKTTSILNWVQPINGRTNVAQVGTCYACTTSILAWQRQVDVSGDVQ